MEIMLNMNKKGLSGIIITVLLILLTLSIAGMVALFSSNFLDDIKRDGASTLSRTECPKKFGVQLQACYNQEDNSINLSVINLKEAIPTGSLLALESSSTRILTLIIAEPTTNPLILDLGQSRTMKINPAGLNFSAFQPKIARVVPVYSVEGIRVLCDELEEVEITKC